MSIKSSEIHVAWISKDRMLRDEGEGRQRSECGYRSFHLPRILARGRMEKNMVWLELESSVGERLGDDKDKQESQWCGVGMEQDGSSGWKRHEE